MQVEQAGLSLDIGDHDYVKHTNVHNENFLDMATESQEAEKENMPPDIAPYEPALTKQHAGPSGVHQVHARANPASENVSLNITTKNILGPVRSRAKKTNYLRRSGLDYLREKQEREKTLEERRIAIEDRKIAVAERQITLAENKFQLESEQQRALFDRQQEMINNLMDLVKKFT